MYLIDTVVLSELRKREEHPGIVRWLRDKAADALFLSAITVGEIERGVLRQRGSKGSRAVVWMKIVVDTNVLDSFRFQLG